MNRTALLLVAVLLAAALAGVFALLAGDEGAAPAGPALPGAGAVAPQGLPTFRTGDGEAAPEELARPAAAGDAAPPAAGAPRAAPSARPAGPVRRLAGRVVRASDGTPLGGIAVTCVPPEREPGPSVISSEADGRFTLDAAPQDAAELELTLVSGPLPRAARVAVPPGAEPLDGLELVFDSGFRVQGLVLDATGHPLPGARIDVARRAAGVADESGRFLVRDVLAAPGETVLQLRADAPWHARGRADVLVPRSPEALPSVELRLVGSGRIEGSVTHPDRRPAEGVRVECAFRMDDDGRNEILIELGASCDAEGRYLIDQVPEGRYLVTASQLCAPGTPPSGQAPVAFVLGVEVVAGRSTALDIALPAPAAIAGRVLDSSGRALVGARVALRRILRWPAPTFTGHMVTLSDGVHMEVRAGPDGVGQTTVRRDEASQETGPGGLYAFEGLAEGLRELEVRDAEGRLAPATRALEVRAGTRHEPLDFVLAAGLALRAQVVDEQGRALEGVAVHVAEADANAITGDDLRAHSGADGWFEVDGLTPARKTLSLALEGYGYVWEQIDPASPPTRFVMLRAPQLRGRVVDAQTDEPVEAYSLLVETEGAYMTSDVQPHPDGVFATDVGPDARCRVTIGAPGYQPLVVEELRPRPEGEPLPTFRLLRQP